MRFVKRRRSDDGQTSPEVHIELKQMYFNYHTILINFGILILSMAWVA